MAGAARSKPALRLVSVDADGRLTYRAGAWIRRGRNAAWLAEEWPPISPEACLLFESAQLICGIPV